ncbi:MAG: TRAP transporter permease DctQ [Magnetovibrio sp.]|nr:TRAP transporter permease DctQ [Magnetovibrio sp.]
MRTDYEVFSGFSRSAIKTIDQISVLSGKVFAWLIIPMVLSLVYEVFARYLFNAPTLWAYDMTYMLYGSHFMLGAAYTLAMQGHIRTDFFYRIWSVRWQGVVDSLLYIFFFFPSIVLWFYAGFDFAATSWDRGEVGISSPWKPIIYPFKTVMPLTCILLLLQGVSELVKSLYAARYNKWPMIDGSMDAGDQV